jgi:23S rRNA pseudouridine1911/1915/1917 synthase
VKLSASTESVVLEVLKTALPEASGRTLRQMLEQGRVRLNGEVCRLAKQPVSPGDVLEIGRRLPALLAGGLKIVYEDRDIVVVHKSAGLLTVATPHESENTAHAFLRRRGKSRSAQRTVFVVHRLDKFVSGLLVFAKSEAARTSLRSLFEAHAVDRKYWAIVEGRVENDSGTIESNLAEDRTMRMHSTSDPREGKRAVTHYRVLGRFPGVSVLEITLETGRKNQIRAHLSELGHPIVGDRAYGSAVDPLGRMGLHAFRLGFTHPSRHEPVLFETEPPAQFLPFLRTG